MTKKTTTICCAVALLATTAATPALSQVKTFKVLCLDWVELSLQQRPHLL
jgi:hypothetical protein